MTRPDPAALEALAAACEAASGPDRELDARVAEAVYGREAYWLGDEPKLRPTQSDAQMGISLIRVEHYTSSRDAMLPGEAEGYWEISGPHPHTNVWVVTQRLHSPIRGATVSAATEPLARRAAALRALAAETKEAAALRALAQEAG